MQKNSSVIIKGSPAIVAEFHGVPSRNARKHWAKTKSWRRKGEAVALKAMGRESGFLSQLDPFLPIRSLVICTLYVRDKGIADSHNPDIKPILDGFSDAGVWPDDEWAHVPLVLFAWGGFSDVKIKRRGRKRASAQNKVVIEVYELDTYIKQGQFQDLPEGRIWVK